MPLLGSLTASLSWQPKSPPPSQLNAQTITTTKTYLHLRPIQYYHRPAGGNPFARSLQRRQQETPGSICQYVAAHCSRTWSCDVTETPMPGRGNLPRPGERQRAGFPGSLSEALANILPEEIPPSGYRAMSGSDIEYADE